MISDIIDYLASLVNAAAYRPGGVAVEIGLIGVVVYVVLRFLRGTRGAHLLHGLIILLVGGVFVVRVLADRLELDRIAELYEPFVWSVLLTTLVVFQPELRRGLMRLGETRFRRIRPSEIDRIARATSLACAQLSKDKIGALIAIEREIGLSGLADRGVRVDALITPQLLVTIFWPGSALHDLGVIVQRGRVTAAACPFPFADEEAADRSLGSRHRAAIGLSQDSDAVVVVVSEETGSISIAENGRLYRHIPPDTLFETLRRHLTGPRGAEQRRLPPGQDWVPARTPVAEHDDHDSDESPVDACVPIRPPGGQAAAPAEEPAEAAT